MSERITERAGRIAYETATAIKESENYRTWKKFIELKLPLRS